MRRKIASACALVAILALALGLALANSQAAPGTDLPTPEAPPEAPLETAVQPAITFITSDTAYCYQPDPAGNACYINWHHIDVQSAPAAYMYYMTVTIDSRIRGTYRGFFQNRLQVPAEMHGQGFQVACGNYGSSGDPALGKIYPYQIHAQDSDNLKAANYGQVACPGTNLIYLPLAQKQVLVR